MKIRRRVYSRFFFVFQVFVAEGEPAMFECRVEPKHDLNLAVRWYRNDEELVSFTVSLGPIVSL